MHTVTVVRIALQRMEEKRLIAIVEEKKGENKGAFLKIRAVMEGKTTGNVRLFFDTWVETVSIARKLGGTNY